MSRKKDGNSRLTKVSGKASEPLPDAYAHIPPQILLGYRMHDSVSVSLLRGYARCMALKDKDARWQAQMMFHQSQLARDGGGTQAHKLGYRLKDFLTAHENGVPVDKSGPLWR